MNFYEQLCPSIAVNKSLLNLQALRIDRKPIPLGDYSSICLATGSLLVTDRFKSWECCISLYALADSLEMFVFDKREDDVGLAKCNRVVFFLSVKVRDGNSSNRQSHWHLAMSNCFVLMQPELVSALSSFHTCTHPLLGQLQPPVMAQGEPNCCFSSLGLEVSKCVKCTCVSVNPQLLENTLD